jgi:hypothetical protein
MTGAETVIKGAVIDAFQASLRGDLLRPQPFPVIKLGRLRVHRLRAVKSKKSPVSLVSIARKRARPAKAVRSRKLLRVAEPPTGVVPQAS